MNFELPEMYTRIAPTQVRESGACSIMKELSELYSRTFTISEYVTA